MSKSSIIRVMENAVLKAGKALARDYGEVENLQVSRKGPGDFVTSADHRVEKILREELAYARPDIGFLGEECGFIEGKDTGRRWIVDPIDGTTNFMHGIPYFCINVALEERIGNNTEITAAITFAPALQELFVSEKGHGAMLNDRRLRVSGRDNLESALVAAYVSRRSGDINPETIASVTGSFVNIRVLGSAALELAYVAAGKLEAMWNSHLKPWDVAAGILHIRESFGTVTEMNGEKDMLNSGSILASNSLLHDRFLNILNNTNSRLK